MEKSDESEVGASLQQLTDLPVPHLAKDLLTDGRQSNARRVTSEFMLIGQKLTMGWDDIIVKQSDQHMAAACF